MKINPARRTEEPGTGSQGQDLLRHTSAADERRVSPIKGLPRRGEDTFRALSLPVQPERKCWCVGGRSLLIDGLWGFFCCLHEGKLGGERYGLTRPRTSGVWVDK